MAEIELRPLPFDEAIDFFRGKVPLTAEAFKALSGQARDRAFTLAGAASADLVADVKGELLKALEEGATLEEFRKNVNALLERKGWTGLNPWHAENIFRTNIQTAYSAGRWAQYQETKGSRPYLMYDAVNDDRTRTSHRAMDGHVAHMDDAFWQTWYPPNGFRCRCGTISLSARDVERMGLEVSEGLPQYVVDPSSGQPIHAPQADRGWDRNPGAAFFGDGILRQVLEEAPRYQELSGKTFADQGRSPVKDISTAGLLPHPGEIPSYENLVRQGLSDEAARAEVRREFRQALGIPAGEREVILADPTGDRAVFGDPLFDHFKMDGRERHIRLIRPTFERPYEVWLAEMRDESTGRVVLRKRYVGLYLEGDGKRPFVVVLDVQKGVWSGWTAMTSGNWNTIDKLRRGVMLFGR